MKKLEFLKGKKAVVVLFTSIGFFCRDLVKICRLADKIS